MVTSSTGTFAASLTEKAEQYRAKILQPGQDPPGSVDADFLLAHVDAVRAELNCHIREITDRLSRFKPVDEDLARNRVDALRWETKRLVGEVVTLLDRHKAAQQREIDRLAARIGKLEVQRKSTSASAQRGRSKE